MVGARAVADLMTKEVVTLVANDTLNVADDVMSLARIRHMPVVDEDGLVVGLISQRDLFRGHSRERWVMANLRSRNCWGSCTSRT